MNIQSRKAMYEKIIQKIKSCCEKENVETLRKDVKRYKNQVYNIEQALSYLSLIYEDTFHNYRSSDISSDLIKKKDDYLKLIALTESRIDIAFEEKEIIEFLENEIN